MHLENKEKNMRNNRHINAMNVVFKTRLLPANTSRFKPSNKEKVQIMINLRKRLLIDSTLLNTTKTKQMLQSEDKIKKYKEKQEERHMQKLLMIKIESN